MPIKKQSVIMLAVKKSYTRLPSVEGSNLPHREGSSLDRMLTEKLVAKNENQGRN